MTLTRSYALDMDAVRAAHPFSSLVGNRYGLIENVSFLPLELGEIDLEVAATGLGALHRTWPHLPSRDWAGRPRIGGGGADLDAELSWVRAVVEAAERYSTIVYEESDFVVAPAKRLGAAAIPLQSIPRCSVEEYADPRCPIRPPNPNAPIRWVLGHSLVDDRERLVPAIMTHLELDPWQSERFWMPISTGVAAHTSVHAAAVAAICESIERDALALTWLLRRRPTRVLEPLSPPEELSTLLSRVSSSRVTHHTFDITTDLGVPTVMGVQLTDGHPNCDVFVSCATSMDASTAFEKAIREASPGRAILSAAPPHPDDVADFFDLTHGATYYGAGGHRDAFRFLLDSPNRLRFEDWTRRYASAPGSTERADLAFLVDRLRAMEMDAVVVDLTTDEVREAGLWVVRVIIPQLVPISFVHRARYLGTPRLIGHAAGVEINDDPLPFA